MWHEVTLSETESRDALRVEWEVTRACDLSCAHCYARPHHPRPGEASTSEALAHARFLSRTGARVVALSGGEPTLRQDLPALVEALARDGVIPTLLSHGQRLDGPLVRSLADAGLVHVQLSLDGMGATHDRIRRSPGAFLGVLRAAAHLRSVGLSFGFTTTLLRQNLGDLEALADLAVSQGAALWQPWLGLPRHRGAQWISPREVPGLLARLEELAPDCPALALGDNLGYQTRAERLRPVDWLGMVGPQAAGPGATTASRFGGCEAGRRVLWLQSDGSLAPCPLMDSPPIGRVGQEPGAELLARGRSDWQERRAALGGACGSCPAREPCAGGCHGAALWRTGRLENPYCARALKPAEPGLGRRIARVAGGVVMAASLTAGCGAPASPRSVPGVPDAAEVPRADAAARQSVGGPALGADAGLGPRPVPESPPRRKVTPAPAGQPHRWGSMPRCCMMHVLVPGCKCGGPSLPAPAPSPPKRP